MLANAKTFNSFAVDDLAKAQEFYGETLGLKVSVLDENNLMSLDRADGPDTLVYLKPDDFEPATYTILNF